jgi:hypothetical protein
MKNISLTAILNSLYGHAGIYIKRFHSEPIPATAPSKECVCGRSLAGIADSSPAGALISVCCECFVLSGRSLCDTPIPRPYDSYTVCMSLNVILKQQ